MSAATAPNSHHRLITVLPSCRSWLLIVGHPGDERRHNGRSDGVDPYRAPGDSGAHGGRIAGGNPFTEPGGACLGRLADEFARAVGILPALRAAGHDVERAWIGAAGVDETPDRGHLLRREWFLAVVGAAGLGRRVEHGPVPAGRPAQ